MTTTGHFETANPNPQGKGLVPILKDWELMKPHIVSRKSGAEFLRDYCISSLVLAADFRIKPVIGNTYFLYVCDGGWMMSLIAPEEWVPSKSENFLSRCRVRQDMTWEIDTDDLSENSAALEKVQNFVRAFVDALSEQGSIAEHLPFYVEGLPYYRRMMATALAASLGRSMPENQDELRASLHGSSNLLGLPASPGLTRITGAPA